jgi:uncharacterized protein YecT (DUF1311 family)
MGRSLPLVRLLDLIRRCLASLMAASLVTLASAVAQEKDADEGGEDVLVLSMACGNRYYDTPSIGRCLDRQRAKVDRWLQAVIESYTRWATKEMETRRKYGGTPPDLIAQLQKSQTAFDTYRSESADLVEQSIDGSMAPLAASMTYLDLTVERVRFLIVNCYGGFARKPTDEVDLTTPEWCSTGPQ